MKDLKELLKELKKNYENKDLSIRFEGSLKTSMQMHNAQCMVTSKVLIISNSEFILNEEIEICVDDIIYIEIGDEICLQMNGNYNIFIVT